MGKAKTTIKMYPSSKSKKKKAHLENQVRQRFKRIEIGDDIVIRMRLLVDTTQQSDRYWLKRREEEINQ